MQVAADDPEKLAVFPELVVVDLEWSRLNLIRVNLIEVD
jgi:hypothetical protein